MSGYQENTVNSRRLIIWSLLESAGLAIILAFDLGFTLLAFKFRLKLWKWLSIRRFKKTIRKSSLPNDLEEYLVDSYTKFLEESLSFEHIIGIKSLRKWLSYTKLSRGIKIH